MDLKKIPQNTKRILMLVLPLIVIIAAYFFGKPVRLPEQAMICGVNVSDLSVSDAKKLLEDKVSNYSAQVTVGDQVFEIAAEDLGLRFLSQQFKNVVTSAISDGISPDPWSVMTLDRDKLTECIAQNFDEQRTACVAPAVVFDESSGSFGTMPGEPETWYDREILEDMLLEGIATLSAELHISKNSLYQEYHDPALQASAEALATKANSLMEQEIEYKFRPRQYKLGEIVLDGATIASFLRFDVENDLIYTDEQAVTTYVEYLAPKYKYEKLRDRFLAHDGGRVKLEVTVQPQSVDKEGFIRLIAETVTAGTSGSFEVPYIGARNFEGTYIEASIPDQHLWVYQNDVCVLDTPIVTGFEGIGKFTPVGLNYVRGHLRNIELFGDSFVEYCMAFTTGGTYCFHDANHWREPEEYGGVTYQSHGSSGCVNIPVEKMAKMYELVEDGTPVLIHHYYHYDAYSFPE